MEFFSDPAFFVLCVPVVAIAVVLGVLERPLKAFGTCASLAMLSLLFFRTPASGLYAAAYIAMSIALFRWQVRAFEGRGPDAPPASYRVALALQLAPLLAYKVGVVVTPTFPGFLGISYITFKGVQVLVEVRDGLIAEGDMTCSEYLFFLAFFPTFTSGPIMRSRPFVRDLRTPLVRDAYLERLYLGIGWFVLGAVYAFVGAPICAWALWFVPSVTVGALAWASRTLFFGLDLFFDFAGYSAMAQGLGYALGVEVPRNFRAPFAATDIKEFWDRWHISLSWWLRDFLFMRLVRRLLERRVLGDRTASACVAFLVDMAVMGLWHGITFDYVAYGLYHGALLALYHWYQQKSSFYKAHRRDGWYRALSWAITMVAVFFGFALFAGYVTGR